MNESLCYIRINGIDMKTAVFDLKINFKPTFLIQMSNNFRQSVAYLTIFLGVD